MSVELKPALHIAFSTLSANYTETSNLVRDIPKIAFPRQATPELANRVVKLEDQLSANLGPDVEISTSLHLARNIEILQLANLLEEYAVAISGIDLSDVYGLRHIPFDSLLTVLKSITGKSSLAHLKNHAAWYIANVSSNKQFLGKLNEGLQVTDQNPIQIVRANASLWIEYPQRAKLLEKHLSEYQSQTGNLVALAIEIHAEKQSPNEYLNFILNKREDLKSRLSVYADIDLGHTARSKDQKANRDKSIQEPLSFLEQVLYDEKLSKIVKVISLNQFIEGNPEAHAMPDTPGGIDLVRAAYIMGRSVSMNNLENPYGLLETYPYDYKWFFQENGGVIWCQKLPLAYQEGLEKKSYTPR